MQAVEVAHSRALLDRHNDPFRIDGALQTDKRERMLYGDL